MKRITTLLAAGLVLFAAASLPTIRAGAQQAAVTDDNLDQMIASAKAPADHRRSQPTTNNRLRPRRKTQSFIAALLKPTAN
jgi:hypothetical protein